ncbi:hypothetical protein IC229_34065 [Spirosoma sp. BT702]|uniref:Uncharacterized protein n=1 Tax=Spirosoma profusum TaxID=2771354 RepID=A0A927GB05_9BACT|nr:hypothetical protein [Spirosoma profusum]MBD2705684.1 hypothetical protein [Spirosoma profusum]
MKSINIAIDLRSFSLGAFTLGILLTFINFKPNRHAQPEPAVVDTRRFQVVASEHQTIILNTKTGRFILDPFGTNKPKWVIGDFEEVQKRDGK